MSDAQVALLPVACTASLLSCMRPTMSKLRYAAICATGIGGALTNAFDPIRPSSSADHSATTRLRRRTGRRASASATASTAALPDALSSAPTCGLPASAPRRERVAVAPEPEMVVVRADHDPRLVDAGHRRRGRQVRHHVAGRPLLANELGGEFDGDSFERKARDVRVAAIELLLHRLRATANRTAPRRPCR